MLRRLCSSGRGVFVEGGRPGWGGSGPATAYRSRHNGARASAFSGRVRLRVLQVRRTHRLIGGQVSACVRAAVGRSRAGRWLTRVVGFALRRARSRSLQRRCGGLAHVRVRMCGARRCALARAAVQLRLLPAGGGALVVHMDVHVLTVHVDVVVVVARGPGAHGILVRGQ